MMIWIGALLFFVNSAALGVGLAMDAFSVSLANGLNEPQMKKETDVGIAGVFAFFQWFMPMLGWIAVHTIVQYFTAFEKAIPWIALGLIRLYRRQDAEGRLQKSAMKNVRKRK
jgi:putative Mn2+ efflux pump MntP